MEGQGGLANGHGGSFLAHLLSLQVTFQRIKKEAIVWYTVPVENLLFLLRADAVVLVKKVQKGTLGLLERRISPRLQIPQVRKDSFFELLRVLDWPTKCLESEGEATDDVSTGDVEQIVPQHTRDIFTRWEEKSSNVLIWLPVDRCRNEEIFYYDCIRSLQQSVRST